MWKDIITLCTEIIIKDSDGYTTKDYEYVEVYANKKSVARAEFYPAYAVGIEAKIAFEVRSEDYAGQKDILHDDKAYEVIRSFQKGEGIVELTCSDKAV